jgi:2-dehydropantoate 2-reductase
MYEKRIGGRELFGTAAARHQRVRYVVYGAGAIGGTLAARLALAGHHVVAIARGEHLRAIQEDGLRLQTPDEDVLVQLEAVGSADEAGLEPDDVTFLAVKSQDTAAALAALARSAPPELAVVCAQNGIDNERQALRRFARVYGLLVYLPAQHLEPGVVQTFAAPVNGVLDVGCVPAGVDATAEAIARDLEAAGFASRTVTDVMAWKRAKLVRNLGNALDALMGEAAEEAGELEERAAEEARACFAAAGLEVVDDGDALARMRAMSKPRVAGDRPRGGSSSWQSLARGSGSIEADWLNGEIVLLGRLHGVPTPVNEALQTLANEHAARRGRPGSVSRDEISARVTALLGR